ncbi:hypothetical protein AX16_006117 [Volvariella volvacea WC 439]|nr:hypothetical protein AX16_006117 [Volvariella volvacea WC 439]
MAASRTDLLRWLNDLLQLNYTKIEQCGTGGAYCQIMDSIYGDVPMSRVKMNAKHTYEYTANLKVLQNVFKAKKIDKPIPIDKLINCKMQDNLEFLQWIKRFWDANYGGQPYDPVARRKGVPVDTPSTIAPLTTPASASRSTSANLHVGGGTGRAGGKTPIGGHRSASAASNEAIHYLQNQIKDLGAQLEGCEKERDFYFFKLRKIEDMLNEVVAEAPEKEQDPLVIRIQEILYQTEEGFEVPDQAGAPVDEEETF